MNVLAEVAWIRRAEFLEGIYRRLKLFWARAPQITRATGESDVCRPLISVADQREPEVSALYPASDVAAEHLLLIAASAKLFSTTPPDAAISRKARSLGLSLHPPEDLHFLAGGGIHCWLNGMPTLVGSRSVLARLGIDVSSSVHKENSDEYEIFVAQGRRLLGRIEISYD